MLQEDKKDEYTACSCYKIDSNIDTLWPLSLSLLPECVMKYSLAHAFPIPNRPSMNIKRNLLMENNHYSIFYTMMKYFSREILLTDSCAWHIVVTHFPAHGIMSLSQWLSQWRNDIMPCTGKRVNDIVPCARHNFFRNFTKF